MKQFKDYTFTAKHKLSGKKVDATEAIMELYASVDAWKDIVEGQQAILVDCVNRLEKIQEVIEDVDYYNDGTTSVIAFYKIKTILEAE